MCKLAEFFGFEFGKKCIMSNAGKAVFSKAKFVLKNNCGGVCLRQPSSYTGLAQCAPESVNKRLVSAKSSRHLHHASCLAGRSLPPGAGIMGLAD